MRIYKAYAKCILSGEHTVLRGGSAIVCSCKDFVLSLNVENSENLDFVSGDFLIDKELEFLLRKSFVWLTNNTLEVPVFKYVLSGNVPIGKGLGFSAALCSVVAGFCCEHTNKLELKYSLAHELENCFHGKSSGLDVVGVNASTVIKFESIDRFCSIENKIPFNVAVTFCDISQIIKTKSYVDQVFNKLESNFKHFNKVDSNMKKASFLMEKAICNGCLDSLIMSFKLSFECYEAWGLVNEADRSHINELYSKGAVAVRITGAGGYGSYLSVWGAKNDSLNFL